MLEESDNISLIVYPADLSLPFLCPELIPTHPHFHQVPCIFVKTEKDDGQAAVVDAVACTGNKQGWIDPGREISNK